MDLMSLTAKDIPAPAKELTLLGIAKQSPGRYEQMKKYAKENPTLAAMTGFPAEMFDRVDAIIAGEDAKEPAKPKDKKKKVRDPKTGVVLAVEEEKSNTLMWVLAGVGALGVGYYLYTRR
jgi:hypothetical protein